MVDVFLWPVPSDPNPNDVRLRDPTAGAGGIAPGAGSASFAFTADAVGATVGGVVSGDGSASFTFAPAATGAATFAGLGAASFAFTPTGTGAATFGGTGAASFAFTPAATGRAIIAAVGSVTFLFLADGVGSTAGGVVSGEGAASFSFAADAVGQNATPPAAEDDGGAQDNRRGVGARHWIKPQRTTTIAELEAELAARLRRAWPAVEEELADAEPAEAALRAEEIRAGRPLSSLPRADLLALAAEVTALAAPLDAAAMLRVIVELRDEDDAAALLLLMM